MGLLVAGAPLVGLLTFIGFLLAIAPINAALPLLLAAFGPYWQGHTGWAVFLAIWGLFVPGSQSARAFSPEFPAAGTIDTARSR